MTAVGTAAAAEAPPASEAGRYDAFLSYAREDSHFVIDRLCVSLRERGHEVWVDVDITGGAKWRDRVRRGIEACKAFIFVISRDSVASEACQQELEDAIALNKLIIPVVYRDDYEEPLPAPLPDAEWVLLRNGDDPAVGTDRLVEALETDLPWRDQHTRLAGRAREWLDSGRDRSYLVRGSDLRHAEGWLAQQEGHREAPTREQGEYIARSRQAAGRRLYALIGGLTAGLAVAVGLSIFALIQRASAQRQATIATSRQLAAQSLLQLKNDPELSLLLAVQSAKASRTTESLAALRQSISANHLRRTMRGDGTPLTAAGWSADGRLAATGGQDGDVRVWDTATGKLVHELRARAFEIRGVAFDGSGTRLLINPREGDALIWSFVGGTPPVDLRDPVDFRVDTASWSPDYRYVLTAACTTAPARLWDAANGRLLRNFGQPNCADARFSPNGRLVATASGGFADLWDTASGRFLRAMSASGPPLGQSAGSPPYVDSVRFSPNGRYLLTAAADGTARIFDVRTGRQLAAMPPHTDNASLAVWSPNRLQVATASDDHTGRIWNPTGDGEFLILRGHNAKLDGVQFSPNGNEVVTSGADGLAQVFDSQTGTPIAELLGHQNGDVAAAFSPDGRSILTAGQDGTLRLWDTGVVQPTPSQRISFARDEVLVASGFAGPDPDSLLTLTKVSPLNGNRPGGKIRDATTGAPVAALAGDPDVVFRASFDGRGTLLFTADESPSSVTVAGRVWNARTGALVRVLAGPGAAAIDGLLSDDGKLLATVDQAGVVTVWRTVTGQRVSVFTRHKQSRPPYGLHVSLTFSHDGSLLLTGDSAGQAYLWRVRDGRVLTTYRGAPQPPRSDNGAASGAISRDDTTVLFTDPWDQVGKLYRVGSGTPIGLLRGTSTGIRSASFNADGSLLVTNGFDGDRVWDVASRQPLLAVTDPAAPFPATVRFGSDGRSIISAAPNEFGIRASYRQTFACDVCGDIDALLTLARQRLSRGLTPSERKQFLHQ